MQGIEAFAIATGPTSVAPLTASDDGLGMLALAYHNLRDVMSTSMVLDAGARTFIDGPEHRVGLAAGRPGRDGG